MIFGISFIQKGLRFLINYIYVIFISKNIYSNITINSETRN